MATMCATLKAKTKQELRSLVAEFRAEAKRERLTVPAAYAASAVRQTKDGFEYDISART